MKKILLLDVLVFLLIVLFMYTGVYKIFGVETFYNQMQRSPLIRDYGNILSWSVPIIEIVVAVMLIVDQTRLIGLYSALILMVVFTIYAVINLVFKEYQACSCGGVISSMTWPQHLVFNVLFMLVALAAVVIMSRRGHKVAVVA